MVKSLRTWLWAGTFLAGATALLLCALSGFGMAPDSRTLLLAYIVAAVACCLIDPASWGKHAAILTLAECFLLFTLMGALGAILSYMAMVHSDGFTDQLLARSDEALGFSWPAIHAYVSERPWLNDIMARTYFACFLMPFIVFALLYRERSRERLYRYLLAYGLALAVTVAIFFFFPAQAAFAYYLDAGTDIPGSARHYGAVIEGLRDGSLRTLDVADLGGIITFPSFHASMAILFVWAAWPVRSSRVPMVVVNGLMWVAAVPIGGHYVVDLLGGSVVAILAIGVAKRVGKPANPAEPAHPSEALQPV